MPSSLYVALACSLLTHCLLPAQEPAPAGKPTTQTIAKRTAAMQHSPGFLPLDYDAKAGKLFLEIPHPGADLLWTDSLPYGTGSNDLGLDRGQTAPASLVRFEREGDKVLLIQRNTSLTTSATDPAEVLATRQSFPESVLFGFKLEAENPDGSLLVDATDFFLRDVHHVTEALVKQGAYKLDTTRSAIAIDSTKAFPRNTEVESILSFTTDDTTKANFVSDVTPDPHSLTVRERQSFIALPEPGFSPRRYDPRSGYFDLTHRDYSAPLGADLDQRFIERHRLIKKDPNCRTDCEPVEPITYYVDRGAPEPIRSALVEGARWWNDAFSAAGWRNAFRVEVLPADADPMDVRYNIIQWVHRYTRGWSYGATVTDPRTGEILKGNVTLGSLRGRQDYLIAEALLAPYTGPNAHGIADPARDPMLQMVLARIRQLAAHETGHTLGLAHNFAASTAGQGTSVMDYPHPYITLTSGAPDLSHAYAVGIGAWDKVAIDYGYRDLGTKAGQGSAPEHLALDKILTDSEQAGLPYITDQDARPLGSANPKAHLWDNGSDPVAELNRILEVRKAALGRFGPAVIREGQPMATLQEALVPLYLLHRYQTEAAAKLIAGMNYTYNLRGDREANPTIIDPATQQKALDAVLGTLKPEVLDLPENILAIMPPHPPGYGRTRESFKSDAGAVFDPVAAAESAADLTLSLLCNPERATRLFELHMRINKTPGLRTVLEGISNTTAERPEGGHTTSSEIERAVEFRGLEAMLALSVEPNTASQARAIARSHIDDLYKKWTTEPMPTDSAEAIHRRSLIDRVQQYLKDPAKFTPTKPIEAPPGMPIGTDDEM